MWGSSQRWDLSELRRRLVQIGDSINGGVGGRYSRCDEVDGIYYSM